MAAYLLGQIKVRNEKLWDQYLAGVAESLVPFNARMKLMGKKTANLVGDDGNDRLVMLEFIDEPTVQRWFQSDCYNRLVPLRERAADVVISSYCA
ncbi:MAG: DUF1330 domain-containing protein [Oleiphilaceae bacterium]|nr:DUF1330 domain-containing protein [Oleiphilaceae bacterium]